MDKAQNSKVARKAGVKPPASADKATTPPNDEEKAKAKAERKAAKAAQKTERKKAAAAAETPAVAQEKAEAKALRKAQKAAQREKRKNIKASKEEALEPEVLVLSDAEKAKAKSERKAEKAAKKSAEKKPAVAVPAVAALADEQKARAKAERKAAKASQKAERRKAAVAAGPSGSVQEKGEAKAQRKAEKAKQREKRKSAKASKKDASKTATPVLSDAEKAKAKSERKAAKATKKSTAGRTPAAALTLSDEEKAKAKAERKAAKTAKKGEKKASANPLSSTALSDDEKAKAKSERKAAKVEKREAKKASSPSAPAVVGLSDEEKVRAKAERKAAKAEKKSAKKSAPTAALPSVALSEDEKAKAKAERKAAKTAKKSEKQSARGDGDRAALSDEERAAAKAERKAKKAEAKADRKNSKGGDDKSDGDEARETRIALTGFDKNLDGRIRARIEAVLKDSGVAFQWAETDGKSDLAVYAFEKPPASAEQISASIDAIAKDKAKFRIFVGRAGTLAPDGVDPLAAENHAIAMLTCDFDGAFVDIAPLCLRYGTDRALKDGVLTDFGVELVATAILGIAAGGRVSKSSMPRPQWPVPPDLAEARSLSAADVLAQLNWSSPKAPKLLWTHASKESMEAFLDSKIAFSEEQSLDLKLPIAWPPELPNRAAETKVLGLEFLSGPLNYWYVKANGAGDAEIDALIKERGATGSDILARAGKIIIDYADNYPFSRSTAWEENAVSRRARVLALFVLCCKTAAKRKVKFDEAVFLRVFNELLNLIEVLRASDFYEPGSFDGVQQDSLLAGLALTLRKTAYAERLLTESVERLKTLQLNVGLTADGVWRTGTFSDHCTLLSQFKTMLGDFGQSDAALKEPIAAAAKKMTVFAEALLKSDGSPPVFDNSRQKSYLKKLAGTRRALAGAGFSKNAPAKGKPMPRITDTYVFREAQYFASHTTQSPVPDSSLVILHREAGSLARDNPGGISLAFAYGGKDLLVGADPEEGTKKKDKAALFDASLRNGYQINGTGYVPEQEFKPGRARLTKSWRGEGWAAAKSIDETNPAGSLIRTVIHLKPQHALVVVDELHSTDGSEASFEQFWHIAPGLTARGSTLTPLNFANAEGGNLAVAFDSRGTVSSEAEGEGGTGNCVRRSFRLAKGVVASLFQWADAPAPAAIEMRTASDGSWSLEASGNGFDARISLAGEELRYEPKVAV